VQTKKPIESISPAAPIHPHTLTVTSTNSIPQPNFLSDSTLQNSNLNTMSDENMDVDSMPLFTSSNEYDPSRPNDYEQLVMEREAQRKIEIAKKKAKEHEKTLRRREREREREHDRDSDRHSDRRDREQHVSTEQVKKQNLNISSGEEGNVIIFIILFYVIDLIICAYQYLFNLVVLILYFLFCVLLAYLRRQQMSMSQPAQSNDAPAPMQVSSFAKKMMSKMGVNVDGK
jgi:hypothetical protein